MHEFQLCHEEVNKVSERAVNGANEQSKFERYGASDQCAHMAKRYSLFVIFNYSNKNGDYLHLIFLLF